MKNKKIVIFVLIVILTGLCFGVYTVLSSYLFNMDGTITDGHQDLINKIKSVENVEQRKNMIDFSLEQNIITVQEANELY